MYRCCMPVHPGLTCTGDHPCLAAKSTGESGHLHHHPSFAATGTEHPGVVGGSAGLDVGGRASAWSSHLQACSLPPALTSAPRRWHHNHPSFAATGTEHPGVPGLP